VDDFAWRAASGSRAVGCRPLPLHKPVCLGARSQELYSLFLLFFFADTIRSFVSKLF